MERRLCSLALLLVLATTLVVAVSCKGDPSPAVEVQKPTSEVGVIYVHTKTNVTWASEKAKSEMLDEMEVSTEKDFFNLYDAARVEVEFKEGYKAVVYYLLGGMGGTEELFYKVVDGEVSFYDTQEDMDKGNKKTGKGFFAAEFRLSSDFTTLQWIANLKEKCNVTLICTIKK